MKAPAPLIVAAVLATAGCGSGAGLAHAGPSSSPASPSALANLAGRVHFIMNESGIPLQSGHVGCHPNAGSPTVTCYAESAIMPVTKVEGDYTAAGGAGAGAATEAAAGCPGKLKVLFGQTVVTTVAENPCR